MHSSSRADVFSVAGSSQKTGKVARLSADTLARMGGRRLKTESFSLRDFLQRSQFGLFVGEQAEQHLPALLVVSEASLWR
jgi:hypothetical protein